MSEATIAAVKKIAGVKQIDAEKTSRIPIKIIPQPMLRKPEWIRMKVPDSTRFQEIKKILRENNLHTVCEEASCPNIGECFSGGTATFMILGDICTRRCPFCDVAHGKPHPDVFLKAAAKTGVAPERCVVFEDALAGIEAGHAGGMKVVGVATTHPETELTGKVHRVVHRLDELTVADLRALVFG